MKVAGVKKIAQKEFVKLLAAGLGAALTYYSVFGGALAIDSKEEVDAIKRINPKAYEAMFDSATAEYYNTNPKRMEDKNLLKKIDAFLKGTVDYSKCTSIEIDLFHFELADVLKECPNLKTIKIRNASMLDDESIRLLNESNVEHVDLLFDYNELSAEFDNTFDMSRIIKDYTIYNMNLEDDASRVLFYDYLVNYDESKVMETDHIKIMRKQIDEIYNDINQKDGFNDQIKAFNIAAYLIEHLHYETVRDNLKDEKIDPNYYHHPVNTVDISNDRTYDLDENVERYYAKLFTVLAKKAGLSVRTVSVYDKNEEANFTMNLVKYNDEQFYLLDIPRVRSISSSRDLFAHYNAIDDSIKRNDFRKEIMPYLLVESNIVNNFDFNYRVTYHFFPLPITINYQEEMKEKAAKAQRDDVKDQLGNTLKYSSLFGFIVGDIFAATKQKMDEYEEEKEEEDQKKLRLV